MSGADFTARALAIQTQQALPALFSQMEGRAIPSTVDLVHTSGYAGTGTGAGFYICDALATAELRANHPRFTFTASDGRIFRLFPENGSISVEQAGAAAQAGVNDQPVIQATINYAEAVGAREVRFERDHYELWATLRTAPANERFTEDGHLLTVRRSLALRGTAASRTLLDCRGLDGVDPETNWQTVPTDCNDPSPHVWRGGGLFVLGNFYNQLENGLNVERIELDRLILQGNRKRTDAIGNWPANPDTGDGWDVSDKGFWLQDTHVGHMVLTDTDIIGWKGELFYTSALSAESLWIERCRMLTGNGGALNPGGRMPVYLRDSEFGDCHVAWEETGKKLVFASNCLFRDSPQLSIGSGNAAERPVIGTHSHSQREEDGPMPIMQMESCEIRNISTALIGSWVRGRIRTTDSFVFLDGATFGALQDIDLDIDAWLDQARNISPLFLCGPYNLTTQAYGAAEGVYMEPPTRVHVRLRCYRSRLAAENGRHWGSVDWGGLIDPSCSIALEAGEIITGLTPKAAENQPGSFPLVTTGTLCNSDLYGAPHAHWMGVLSESGVIHPRSPLLAYSLAEDIPYDMDLAVAPAGGSEFGYAHGQPLRLYKRENSGTIRFTKGASSAYAVQQTRVLTLNHDWIEFRWNKWAGRWEESGFFTSA